jgi:hypothetical protein
MVAAVGFLFIGVAQVGWRVKEEERVCSVGGERACERMKAVVGNWSIDLEFKRREHNWNFQKDSVEKWRTNAWARRFCVAVDVNLSFVSSDFVGVGVPASSTWGSLCARLLWVQSRCHAVGYLIIERERKSVKCLHSIAGLKPGAWVLRLTARPVISRRKAAEVPSIVNTNRLRLAQKLLLPDWQHFLDWHQYLGSMLLNHTFCVA